MDAGQPDPSNSNPMMSLITGKAQDGGGRQSNASSIEGKHGQKKPNVNVTTNPLDISLIGACASNERTSDGPGRTGGSKLRGRAAAGESSRVDRT